MTEPAPADRASQPTPVEVDGPPRTAKASLHVPADMALYAALAGREPEIDPTLADPLVAAAMARRANPWSPGVLSVYVREVVRTQGSRLNRPEVAAWLRKQSATARRRLAESRARVTPAAFTVAADLSDAADD